MGVGHLAASFAVRGRFPRVALFYLLLAGAFVDVLWGLTILSGLEHAHVGTETGSSIPIVLDHVPYTHSLIACLGWSALVSAVWWLWRRNRSAALVLGALVASHWVLDFVSHVPEMPVLPAGPLVGLGLWRSRAASIAVEIGMLWLGLALYARDTRGKDRIGTVGLILVSVVLTVLGAGAFFGPLPPSVMPLAMGNIVLVLPLLLIGWVDRHRAVASS
jgi:LexA-binding, inner membrane-associated putative hydrolase